MKIKIYSKKDFSENIYKIPLDQWGSADVRIGEAELENDVPLML
jgi:hypothetical protein